MNDVHDPDPSLEPEQEEHVRALLADLGGAPDATSMPPDVTARLEQTLAGLADERRAGTADVVPLRRRWARRTAAAAAAVVVVGLGGVAAANLGAFDGAGHDSTTSGDSSAGSGAGTARSLDGAGDTTSQAPDAQAPDALAPGAQLPELSAASFDTDVAHLLQHTRAPQAQASGERRSAEGSTSGQRPQLSCPGPPTSDGATTRTVLYDGTRAALVVHPDQGGRRLVEAWTCGGDRMLASTHAPSDLGGPGLASPGPTP